MAEKKTVDFSREVDSSITGFALGVTLVSVGLFIWFGEFLHNKIAETIVTIILLLIGICGTFLEIEKVNKKSIKGLGDFGLFFFITSLCVFFIIKYDLVILNIVLLLIVLLSAFVTFSGILKIGYSMKIQRRKSESKNVEIFKVITGITEVIALVVVII